MIEADDLVTVYLPTRNRADLLKRALESVLRQTYLKIEVIVVDDCSEDATPMLIKGLMALDERVKYVRNEKNSGSCASRNEAIKRATGRFITGLDDDDYFHTGRIQAFVDAWYNEDSSCVGLYGADVVENNMKRKEVYKFSRVSAEDLFYSNFIGNQVFVETKTLRELGGFDVRYKAWQDLATWFAILKSKPGSHFSLASDAVQYIDKNTGRVRISTKHSRNIIDSAALLARDFASCEADMLKLSYQLVNYELFRPTVKEIFTYMMNLRGLKAWVAFILNFKKLMFL
jgi:glycosyltransferase involved in cell wall biosynthesis